jgi:hypothetical protein
VKALEAVQFRPKVEWNMEQNLSDRIRERAYEIWVASGSPEGEAEQHWLTAEKEILAILAPAVPQCIRNATDRPCGRQSCKGTHQLIPSSAWTLPIIAQKVMHVLLQ